MNTRRKCMVKVQTTLAASPWEFSPRRVPPFHFIAPRGVSCENPWNVASQDNVGILLRITHAYSLVDMYPIPGSQKKASVLHRPYCLYR
jgi:hypothetical protein